MVEDSLNYAVFVPYGPLVEVVRDALPPGLVGECTGLAGDGEEGFQVLFGEVAGGILGGSVGHEGWGEGVAGGGDEHAGELREKEVRVGGDRVIEAALAELEEGAVLFGCWLCGVSADDAGDSNA